MPEPASAGIRHLLQEANGRIKVRPLPWRLMRLLSPFMPLFRELLEIRYLLTVPVHMGNERLRAVLGTEPHTPLDAAVRDTLIGLGCLKDQDRRTAEK